MVDSRALADAARNGDRKALGRLLSLVEGMGDGARVVLEELFPVTGKAYTVGLTGPPGAGKSTLTDQLIARARAQQAEVAVLAVDPSSPFSGGAILGDRIRMQGHIDDPGVFIRSMASRGHLGGISEATPRALAVLDAVGFPFLFVETVGVGQAEVEIAERADTTIVVVHPRWGDSIQAAKAGLLEIGDIFVVNKADLAGADEAVADLKLMLEMGPGGDWTPPVLTTVATTGEGVVEAWEAVAAHRAHLEAGGELDRLRAARLEADFRSAVAHELRLRASVVADDERFRALAAEVAQRRVDPWTAAERLLSTA